ncbi:MAG: TetR/AcrR family transcriptional regulator [Telluria sp.]
MPSTSHPATKVGRATRSNGQPDLREHILATASGLFYQRGVRAVGVDLVIAEAGIAKTSLYRYFPTKDDLIVAFLEREDADFWTVWDEVGKRHGDDPHAELDAHMRWIGERLSRNNYRGCPQINVAAEFAEQSHPAREVARAHMHALRARLDAIARRIGVARPAELAAQLSLLVNGAFVSSELLSAGEATDVLLGSAHALVAAARGGGRTAER